MSLKLICGFIGSGLAVVVLMPFYIRFLHRINYNQAVSEYALDEFKNKAKTPTMGGVLFVVVPLVMMVIMYPESIQDPLARIVMMAYLGYGLIGFIDDFIIVVQKNNAGLPASVKFLMQFLLAVLFFFLYKENADLSVTIPFFKNTIYLGTLYMPLIFFMFTGASNGVNLTDGMDGLAGGTSFLAFSPFVLLALQQDQILIAAFILCIMGSLLGYLKFNMHPAKIFMGDAGSLALGGALAAIAMVLKQEVALVIIGGVFVWETLCVIIQIGSVKLFHKRVFRYTPIHYAFKLNGMSEPKVVILFWMIGFICAILGFLMGVI